MPGTVAAFHLNFLERINRVLAQRAGFAPGQTWSDAAGSFGVHGMIAV